MKEVKVYVGRGMRRKGSNKRRLQRAFWTSHFSSVNGWTAFSCGNMPEYFTHSSVGGHLGCSILWLL